MQDPRSAAAHAADTFGSDAQPDTAAWWADLERLGEVGSWRVDSSAWLDLSAQAARTLGSLTEGGTRLALDRLVDAAPEGDRERWRAWWTERSDQRESMEIELHLGEPGRRILRFTRHGQELPIGFVQDVSDRWSAVARPSTELDFTTGLPGAEHFLVHLDRGIARAGRRGHRLAVLVLRTEVARPVDDETRGALLAQASERLRQSLRDADVVARLVGDPNEVELASHGDSGFLIMLELAHPHDASNVGRRLLETLSRPIEWLGVAHQWRVAGGIALHPDDGSRPEDLLSHALAAAENARNDGTSSLHYYSSTLNAAAFEKQSLENRLRQALDNNELELFYQPKVEIQTERIVGFEGLLRWRHPELGLVSPAQFIPLAEETGLIIPIGRWVMQQACRDTKQWQLDGLPPIRMAVNLSSAQFREPQLFQWVMGALEDAQLEPKWLELELTESMLMHDVESAAAILRRLKAKGLHISIDDFGTGYSSLSYLKRFPIDALKIDRSFIREINTNPDDAAISTSIILMGRSLKLRVIAEGVETRSQLAFLRVMQCDEAQGFLFSQPVPEPRARALLEAQARRTSGYNPSVDAA